MKNSGTIVLSEINEEDRRIKFNPLLAIDYDLSTIDKAFVLFDFGLDIEICYDSFVTKKYETIEEKIKKYIEFELFHSFFHYKGDPNYSLLNWALYGNLFYRVKCFEKYDENDEDIWSYGTEDGELKMINHEN